MRQPICNDADFLLLAIFFGARHVDEPTKLYRVGVFSTNFKITFTTKTRQSARKVAGWLAWVALGWLLQCPFVEYQEGSVCS